MKTNRSNRGSGNTDSPPAAPKYVRLKAVLGIVPVSSATIWRGVRDGSFPRPVKLSARITAWNLEAIEAWDR